MRIAKIDIAFNDADDVSINVWLPGCKLNCKGCFTPDLKKFNAGFDVPMNEVLDRVKERMELTKIVCLIGGNPPDHENILELTKRIKELGATVWMFSGYEFEKIKNEEWVRYCDYIKAGPYMEELQSKDYRYASTNQKLYKQECGKWKIVEEYNA